MSGSPSLLLGLQKHAYLAEAENSRAQQGIFKLMADTGGRMGPF
jgi:hypothetical protein